MMTIWKSLIQCKLDYCSQLWSPVDQASISRLESVCRHFTAQIAGLGDLDYWERLTALRMYSQERRRERYRIIFIWKILGHVQGYNIPSKESPRPSIIVMHLQLLNKQERQASLCMVPSCLTFFPVTSETSAVAQLTSSRQSWTPGWG